MQAPAEEEMLLLFLQILFFDLGLTWTSVVRHMAEGDFIDSSDTVTEKEGRTFLFCSTCFLDRGN